MWFLLSEYDDEDLKMISLFKYQVRSVIKFFFMALFSCFLVCSEWNEVLIYQC